jgi:hypothetical protein
MTIPARDIPAGGDFSGCTTSLFDAFSSREPVSTRIKSGAGFRLQTLEMRLGSSAAGGGDLAGWRARSGMRRRGVAAGFGKFTHENGNLSRRSRSADGVASQHYLPV